MNLRPTTLENDWVRLDPLDETHRGILKPLANHPDMWVLMTQRGDGAYFDAWFDQMLKAQAEGHQISFAIYDKPSAHYVGHSAFLVITPVHQRVEIGWTWYIPDVRGTHVNPATKHLLLGHAFNSGAKRVELKTHHRNKHSQAAMLKLGAQYEGTLRSHTVTWTGERRGTAWFSILEEEWCNVRAGLEARLSD